MTRLSVNVNKVATLRNTRSIGIPSVVRLARLALEAGAHGITVHPRPDERHIRETDVDDLATMLREFPHAELNVEGNPFHHYMHIVERVRPAQCTLVPDEPSAPTSDHGFDLEKDGDRLRPIVAALHALGARVSLFLDPDGRVDLAKEIGADRIELYTEPYAAGGPVEPYVLAAKKAHAVGLAVNAGHDLNLENLPRFLAHVPHVEEVSIGHALIADALEFGMAATVRRYLQACAAA